MTHAVLIIEDEAVIRQGIFGHLVGCGFTVRQAESASGAIRKVMRHPEVALVFTDIPTPSPMDGCDLKLWVGWCSRKLPQVIKRSLLA